MLLSAEEKKEVKRILDDAKDAASPLVQIDRVLLVKLLNSANATEAFSRALEIFAQPQEDPWDDYCKYPGA